MKNIVYIYLCAAQVIHSVIVDPVTYGLIAGYCASKCALRKINLRFIFHAIFELYMKAV